MFFEKDEIFLEGVCNSMIFKSYCPTTVLFLGRAKDLSIKSKDSTSSDSENASSEILNLE